MCDLTRQIGQRGRRAVLAQKGLESGRRLKRVDGQDSLGAELDPLAA
jgi:hypothetical protein